MEPEGSLTCPPPRITNLIQRNAVYTPDISSVELIIPTYSEVSSFQAYKLQFYRYLSSSNRATCPTHQILFDSIG